jgi:hypothetical protein
MNKMTEEVIIMRRTRISVAFLVIIILACLSIPPASSQQMSSLDRGRALAMLNDVAKDVQEHYYDPQFHGVDWEATVRETKEKIKSSNSLNMAMAHLAQALVSLNDSHTFFRFCQEFCFLKPITY